MLILLGKNNLTESDVYSAFFVIVLFSTALKTYSKTKCT